MSHPKYYHHTDPPPLPPQEPRRLSRFGIVLVTILSAIIVFAVCAVVTRVVR